MSKITNDDLTRSGWHRMLYSCIRMATVGVKGLTERSNWQAFTDRGRLIDVTPVLDVDHRTTTTRRRRQSMSVTVGSHRRPLAVSLAGDCRPQGRRHCWRATHSTPQSAVSTLYTTPLTSCSVPDVEFISSSTRQQVSGSITKS